MNTPSNHGHLYFNTLSHFLNLCSQNKIKIIITIIKERVEIDWLPWIGSAHISGAVHGVVDTISTSCTKTSTGDRQRSRTMVIRVVDGGGDDGCWRDRRLLRTFTQPFSYISRSAPNCKRLCIDMKEAKSQTKTHPQLDKVISIWLLISSPTLFSTKG